MSYEREVPRSLVYIFFRPSCPACKNAKENIEKINKALDCRVINTSVDGDLAMQMGVKYVPTAVIVSEKEEGMVVDRMMPQDITLRDPARFISYATSHGVRRRNV